MVFGATLVPTRPVIVFLISPVRGETADERSMIRIALERSGAAPKSSILRCDRAACDADAHVWHARLLTLPASCERFSPQRDLNSSAKVWVRDLTLVDDRVTKLRGC